jgi:hypothetical protein
MLALEQIQHSVMQAIDLGPDHLPDGVFSGTRSQVLLGMKVHANTISHARLVAIEETFPRTLDLLGHDRFHERSRLYLEHPGVTARPLTLIGSDFPCFLARSGEGRAAADLARFEWLWLEAFHAAEAPVLRLADLAGIEPEALMDIPVQAHPAAKIGPFAKQVHRLIGAQVAGLAHSDAIMITRPEAEVLVAPASCAMAALFSGTAIRITIGNLLAGLSEPGCKIQLSPDDFMPALIALLDVGALQQVA